MVHHFQKLDEAASYRDVEMLQVELDQFTDGLPPHFRMYEPDKSLDESGSSITYRDNQSGSIADGVALFWLPVHRFSLISEIIMTNIILHVSYTSLTSSYTAPSFALLSDTSARPEL